MARVSNNFDISAIYSPKIREREIQPYKDRAEKAAVNVTISHDRGEALQKLQELTAKFQKAIAPFTTDAGKNGIFNLKKAGILTNDIGNGSDYANVSVDNTVPKGQFNIRVDRIATASSVTLGVDAPGNGFPPPPALNSDLGNYIATLNGGAAFAVGNPPKVVINYAGVQYSVSVQNATDTIYDIRDYINTKLGGNNLRASVISNATGDFLAVTSTVTGDKALQINFENSTGILNNDPNVGAAFTHIKANTRGVDAQITIAGVLVTSPSNIIKDIIPGITVELKKPNDAGDLTKNLTIDVTNAVEPVTKSFVELVDAYNELMEFADAQTKTTLINGVPQVDKDAFLANSASLRQATSSVKAIMNFVLGLRETASLSDLGISKPKTLPGSSPINRIEISDPVKLRDAILYRLDDIKKLFQNNVEVAKVGPTTANVTLMRLSEMPAQALGKIIRLSEDVLGNITFTMPGGGVAQAANLNGNVISFPGTVLDGLRLVYTGGNNGVQQDFDIVLSQGIGDKFASQSESLSNKILNEGIVNHKEETSFIGKETIAKEALAKKEKEIDDRVYKLELMALMFDQEMNRLDDMLDLMFE